MVTRILSAVVLAPLFFVVLFFLPPVFLAVLLACITARVLYFVSAFCAHFFVSHILMRS